MSTPGDSTGPIHWVTAGAAARPPESPLVLARNLANADLRQEAKPDEVGWLHAHPLLWLRALARMAANANAHIARDHAHKRDAIAADRAERAAQGTSSAMPSPATLRLVQEIEAKETLRRHFLLKVKQRQAEVAALFDLDADAPMIGDVVQVLVSVALKIEQGDQRGAREQALYWAGRLEKSYGNAQVFADNTDAAPVRVVVQGLAWNTKINCRTCWKGKVDPHGPAPQRCPCCRQQHVFENPGRNRS